MCFYDVERPDLETLSHPIARREHKCCECRTIIGRGEQYERCSGKWDGKMQTFKTCWRCKELRDKVIEHEYAMGCDDDEAVPAFGGLRQALYEMEHV